MCDWSTVPWWTRSDGSISGSDYAYNRLNDHYAQEHPEILAKIEILLEDLEVLQYEAWPRPEWC